MTSQKIYVAGHRGMVGSAIVRQLLAQGVDPSQIVTRTHAELDLNDFNEPHPRFVDRVRRGGVHGREPAGHAGYPRDTTPDLDAVAAEGFGFR